MEYKCNSCGSIFDSNLQLCPNCGAAVELTENQQNTSTENQNQQYGYQQNPNQPYGYQQNQQYGYQQNPNQPYGYQQNPNQPYAYQAPAAAPNGAKSKVAAGLFGILLGTFGVHNFYLGYTNRAIAQLLLTVLSCGVLSGISMVWGLIEGILILTGSISTDANGMPLGE